MARECGYMPPDITKEEADALHAAGHISPELHASIRKRNEPVSRPAAVDTVDQHQETPDERTQRYQQKAAANPTHYADDITSSGMKAYKGLHSATEEHPLTQKMDQKLEELQNRPAVRAANEATERGIDKIRTVVGGGIDRISDRIVDSVLSPDQKIAMNKRKIDQLQSELDKNKPKDIGDIDEAREPVQQEREFSNEADKQEYLKNKLKDKK